MNINKRGISAVIATVLIILITIAAVAIIWAAIIPMLQGEIEGGTACLTAETQLEIVPDYSCKNFSAGPTPNVTKLQIRSGSKTSDVGLTDIHVIFDMGGNSETVKISNSSTTPNEVPDPNTAKVYTINLDTAGINVNNIKGVQIAPVVEKGSSEEACRPGSKITLSSPCK